MILEGKVAIVTGASRGIGEAIAKGYALEGASVTLVARERTALDRMAAEIQPMGGKALVISGDLSKEEAVGRVVKETEKTFGSVDILVNNAGILTPRAPIHRVEIKDWDLSLEINLRSVFLLTRAVLPSMIQRKTGVIINVSSGAGKRAAPEWGPYAVAKFGVEGLTKLVAEEVRPHGIRVNAVNPGGIRTSMRAMAYPDEDPSSLPIPETLVPLFVWLASEKSQGITGESIEWREWMKSQFH